MNDENEKRGAAAARQDPQGDGAKYTPLAFARVVLNGKTLGRPHGRRTRPELLKLYKRMNLIREMKELGNSNTRIAKVCHVHRNTLARFIRRNMQGGRGMTRAELVGELERLAERFWGDGYVKAAAFSAATEVHALLAQVVADCVARGAGEHEADLVAFEAGGADGERRRIVCVCEPFDVDEERADGDAAKPPAKPLAALVDGEAFLLRHKFALEFFGLASAFFGVGLCDGRLALQCRDFAAAKERAEALKGLAARIDDMENGKEVGDAHAAIVAYSEADAATAMSERDRKSMEKTR